MQSRSRAAAAYAVLAYGSWGLMPAYWKGLAALPPAEVLMHRVVGTALFAAALLSLTGRWGEVAAAARRGRHLAGLAASSLLIAANWGIFWLALALYSVEAARALRALERAAPLAAATEPEAEARASAAGS